MRKIIITLSSFTAAVLLLTALLVPALAAGAYASVSRSTVKPGESFSITCNFNSDIQLFSYVGSLDYNPSLVSYVSGAENDTGSSVLVSPTLNGEYAYSFTVTFTAKAEGTANFVFSGDGSNGDNMVTYSDSCSVTVSSGASAPSSQSTPSTPPGPSGDASLVSLRVSGAELVPAFNKDVTNYTATVKYDVGKVTVSATAGAGADVMGAGNADLQFGSNNRTVTVTAADGKTKKSYNINIRRLTKQETEEAEAAERNGDPLSASAGGKKLKITPDVTMLGAYNGYTVEKAKRGETEVTFFKDVSGKYRLYYLTDEKGNGRFYNLTEKGNFEEIYYIRSGLKLYIVNEIPDNVSKGDLYESSSLKVDGITVPAWRFKDKNASDIYIIYCYAAGKTGYYRYDSLEKTISRAPEFALHNYAPAAAKSESESIIRRFKNMDTRGKTVILLMLLAAAAIITVMILLIIKTVKGKPAKKESADRTSAHADFTVNGHKPTEKNAPPDDDF